MDSKKRDQMKTSASHQPVHFSTSLKGKQNPKKLTTLPIPASAPLPNCTSKELNGATTLLNPMVNFTTCTLKANKHFRKWLPSAYESFLQPTGFLQCHSSKHQHLAWPSGMGPQSF